MLCVSTCAWGLLSFLIYKFVFHQVGRFFTIFFFRFFFCFIVPQLSIWGFSCMCARYLLLHSSLRLCQFFFLNLSVLQIYLHLNPHSLLSSPLLSHQIESFLFISTWRFCYCQTPIFNLKLIWYFPDLSRIYIWFFSVVSMSLLKFHTLLFIVSMLSFMLSNIGVPAALNHCLLTSDSLLSQICLHRLPLLLGMDHTFLFLWISTGFGLDSEHWKW